MFKLKLLIKKILKNEEVFFFTIDHLFKKIIIFSGEYKIEIFLEKTEVYHKIEKFIDINNIYEFINGKKYSPNIKKIIAIIYLNKKVIKDIFEIENKIFFKNSFDKVDTKKEVLLILKGGGIEETIEKSFISFCSYSNIKLKVLYKFGLGYWGQQLNQNGFFNELKRVNPDVEFIYNEDFDDEFIDSIITKNTEVFSFQYNYKGKNKDLNLIILSSVSDYEIDLSCYKNIFSSYISKTLGYSTDKFINFKDQYVFKMLNPQNINLFQNYERILPINDFILSGGMEWARDFSILNKIDTDLKGILISDEEFDIKNFRCFYRGIQNYYGFFGAFYLSKFGIYCHLDEFNDDDRTKMIATNIAFNKPLITPYNDGNLVKTIINNKLGFTYVNNNVKDLNKKISLLNENSYNYELITENDYSKNLDVNKFVNTIFNKTFN